MLRLSFLAVAEGADEVDALKPFDIRLIGNLVRDCLDLYAVSWISEGVSSPISEKLNIYFVKYNLYKIRAIALDKFLPISKKLVQHSLSFPGGRQLDFIDKLNELAGRIKHQKDSVLNEEAAKTAFVLPFLQALGYDIFNPLEVIPEFTADHGVKKGEKVDYAIKREANVAIIIECKPVGAELVSKHAGQLYRYFSVTDARFGVLTDGIRYLFFSDLEKENKMDDRPFFEFNLLQFSENQVDELKKFTKSAFDLETIISTASNLKYHRALLQEIDTEFENPSEELVRIFTGRVYSGRFTQQIKEQFTKLTHRALRDFVRERINERLIIAIDTDNPDIGGRLDPPQGNCS